MIAFVLALAAAEPVPIETMLAAAESALQKGKPDRARLMLDEARKAYPRDARVDLLTGQAYAQQEKNEEALAAYRAALAKPPPLRGAYLQLAMLLDVLERYDESDAIYREGVKHFPMDAEIFYEWGTTLILRKRFKAAEEALQKALELQPKGSQIMADLAFVEHKLGRAKDAVRRYEAAFRAGPVEPDVRRHYADALAGSGDLAKAEAIYGELISASGAAPDLWYRRSKVRAARGDKAGAAADLAEWEKRKKP